MATKTTSASTSVPPEVSPVFRMVHLGAAARNLSVGHGGTSVEVDALLFKGFLGSGRDVLIFDRHDVVLHFDHVDFRSKGVVEVCELHTDGSGTNDHHFLGLLWKSHSLEGRDHDLSVVRQIGQVAWAGPSAHQDFVRGQSSVGGSGSFTRVVLITRLPHFNFAWRRETCHW